MVSRANGSLPPGGLPGAGMLPPIGTAPARKSSAGRKPAGDRFAEINGFIDFTLADLTRAAVAVWLILWRDTNPDGTARTGQADLARWAGMSDRAVRAALADLAEAGATACRAERSARGRPDDLPGPRAEPGPGRLNGSRLPAVTGSRLPKPAEAYFRHPRMGP